MTVLAFALTLIVPPALAGPPDDASLVEDNRAGVGFGVTPSDLTAVGNTLFFLADDGVNGEELWKSDGTPGGTEMVEDINPTGSSNAEGLTSFNGKLYFGADNGTNGSELWVSDGSESGTEMVKDFDDNGPGSPNGFEVVNGTLYFAASGGFNVGEDGRELWKSDGTEEGTELVEDINDPDGLGSSPGELTAVGSTLYFTATEGSSGFELYKSDGTGAEIVEDIRPTGGSDPQELSNFNGTLVFTADDGSAGIELYKSDGSGAEIVEDINPTGSSQAAGLTVVGNSLFLAASDGTRGKELWKSTGTAAGTDIVRDINPIGQSFPKGLTNVGGTLFFAAAEVSTGDEELWRSDGTEAGTVRVKDINPGAVSQNSYPSNLIDFGGTLLFRADGGPSSGFELWRSDGTETGTGPVEDVNPGAPGSGLGSGDLDRLVKVGETLFFAAISGDSGPELWKATDTIAPVATIGSGPPASSTDTTPSFAFSSNDPGTFQCRVYRQTAAAPGFGACSGPGNTHTAGPLALGAYRFDVRAADPAGNTGVATRTFSIVAGGGTATPPVTPIATPPSVCPAARTKLADARRRLAKAKRTLTKAKRTLKKAKKAAKAAKKSGNAARSKKARKKLKKARSRVKRATKKVKSARRAVAAAETAVRKACA